MTATGTATARMLCEVRFARGAGLGTRLFPWARCKVFSQLHNCPMIAPQWVQWRVGPLLRGGIDLHSYHRQILLMGLFRENGYVRRSTLRTAGPTAHIAEPERLSAAPDLPKSGTAIVRFEGPGRFFEDFAEHRALLLDALRSEAEPRWLALADRLHAPIGINIRCGNDFRPAESNADYYTKGAIRTPLAWFVETLQHVRTIAGTTIPAVVVSDGTARQLRPVLQLPHVRFARPGCAISDLLTLASTRVLIGSGGSSFSAWASFLSRATTVTHAGQSLEWFRLGRSDGQFVGELAPDSAPSPALRQQLIAALC